MSQQNNEDADSTKKECCSRSEEPEDREREQEEEEEECPICFLPPTTAAESGANNAHHRPLTMGPCGHKFCRDCIERVLFAHAPGSSTSSSGGTATARYGGAWDDGEGDLDAAAVSAPTLGPCPICRSPLKLFELRYAASIDAASVGSTNDARSVCSNEAPQQRLRQPQHQLDHSSLPPNSRRAVYEKDHDIAHSPIAGLVYVLDTANTNSPGIASYHFPAAATDVRTDCNTDIQRGGSSTTAATGDNNVGDGKRNECCDAEEGSMAVVSEEDRHGEEQASSSSATFAGGAAYATSVGGTSITPSSPNLPYISYESPKVAQIPLVLDDGTPPPSRKYFEEGCHWHDKTRTFHGTIRWDDGPTFFGSHRWEYIMAFSSDLRYVCGGSIVMHRFDEDKRRRKRDAAESSSVFRPAHPLDGTWKVTWYHPANETGSGREVEGSVEQEQVETGRITVVAGCFSLFGLEYRLNLSDPGAPSFTWPDSHTGLSTNTQRALSGVNLETEPDGPCIGGTIVWTTDSSDYPKIEWTRESIGGPAPPKVVHFGPRGLIYVLNRPSVDRPPILYYRGNIWGNVFVQGLKVGLASYHFVSERGEGEDGAYICYEHPLCALWPRLDDGSPVPTRVPFSDVRWDATTRTFRGVINWQEAYGTTWQGCAIWRYEMVFDSDFICITSGKVHSVRREGGDETEMSTFGESLIYVNAAAGERLSQILAQHDDEGEVFSNSVPSRQHEFVSDENGSDEHLSPVERTEENGGGNDILDQHQLQHGTHDADNEGGSSLGDVSNSLSRRLEAEGASPRTMMLVQALLDSAQDFPSDEFDTNGTDYLEALRRSASRRSRML